MEPASVPILAVDDEEVFLKSLERLLRLHGYRDLTLLSDPSQLEDTLAQKQFALALLDVRMPHVSGLEVLDRIKAESPETECVMLTADEQTPTVVQALKHGAYDYLVKPVSPERLILTLARATERSQLLQSVQIQKQTPDRDSLHRPEAFADIVGSNERLVTLLLEAELHAVTDIPVLVTGETGVGKELLARAIHAVSPRSARPFLPVNMLALSPSLFESEFFGHAQGAFTGAVRQREGYLARADGGTLFLDEIGDMPMEMQGKLLRILQEPEFYPVGKSRPVSANVRFVAATNQDLERQVRQGQFRRDLYYRLRYAHLNLPPLRDRADDIPKITDAILNRMAPELSITAPALRHLQRYDFPGNVRELAGILQGGANLAGGAAIDVEHFRIELPRAVAAPRQSIAGEPETMANMERRHILRAYEYCQGNKSQTARILDMGLKTLRRKLQRYGES